MNTSLKRLVLLFAAAVLARAAAHAGAAVPENPAAPARIITADWQAVKGPSSEVFRECVGAGRAAEGLRGAWQAQLKVCKDEIGFKSVRFHGLLTDEMGVYSETRDGQPRYNWQYIDQVYDAMLAIGVRPFVEISFMPAALASGTRTTFWWKGNVSPPKSYERWDDLITALARHWSERYGASEVEQWRFEVWNEPDYGAFFAPRDPNHRLDEYLELYAHTAAAIKRADPAFQVGGPAGSGTDWIRPLIQLAVTNNVPLDFISFHTYGFSNLRTPANTATGQRAVIDATARPNLPIHITEWSATPSLTDPVHDSYFEAPFILEQLKHTEKGIASMSYWVFTDIFEESGPPVTPFNGGFGLLTIAGIRKAAFFAYQFRSRLGPTELQNADSASWVCRDAHGGLQVLLWDLTSLTRGDQAVFRQSSPPKPKGAVRVSLANVPAGNYQLALSKIGWHNNDAYSAYLEMGSPPQLTRAQEQKLRDASTGRPEEQRLASIGPDGRFEDTLPLRENDVLLLTLTPALRPQ
jgi:xylan 1,4-beta-xylosidase